MFIQCYIDHVESSVPETISNTFCFFLSRWTLYLETLYTVYGQFTVWGRAVLSPSAPKNKFKSVPIGDGIGDETCILQ